MTDNEKKNYLSLYRLQQLKINRLRLQMKEFPESRERYKQKLTEAENLREKIEREIEMVDGALLTEILGLKYLCGRTFEEIAIRINYSPRQTERLFAKAIKNFRIA